MSCILISERVKWQTTFLIHLIGIGLQQDAKMILLNDHDIYFSFGGIFGREDNSIFCQWNELLSFLSAVFPSNATIFDSKSAQLNCLLEKNAFKG